MILSQNGGLCNQFFYFYRNDSVSNSAEMTRTCSKFEITARLLSNDRAIKAFQLT